jgi:hypothetical protein
MGEHEFKRILPGLIRQIALAAINTAFNMIHARHVTMAGFNGWAENNKTGDTWRPRYAYNLRGGERSFCRSGPFEETACTVYSRT